MIRMEKKVFRATKGSISRHKIAKMNSRFHSGTEEVADNRPLSALQSDSGKCE